jgi:hypothetical protein
MSTLNTVQAKHILAMALNRFTSFYNPFPAYELSQ